MAKLTAWLVTVIGVWLLLVQLGVITGELVTVWQPWIIALAVTVIGIGKLMRNYSKKKKR
ncbi:hypothetical protein J4465_00215 [Candidatus Pacearchaeota archaeon]|nr:hypothetical protein [Candidatus Pacearchaeota archaeon]